MIEFTQSDYDRFASKVILPEDVEDVEACWIWNGAKHGEGRGYGKFHLMGKTMSAHRASFLLFKGMLRKDWVVGHKCNNEFCVSPHHLVRQTQKSNMKYCVECGRHGAKRKAA
jgi:hypothetical protein